MKTTIAVDGVGLVPLVARIADVGERPRRVPRGLKVWFSRGLNIHEPTCWSAFGCWISRASRLDICLYLSVKKNRWITCRNSLV